MQRFRRDGKEKRNPASKLIGYSCSNRRREGNPSFHDKSRIVQAVQSHGEIVLYTLIGRSRFSLRCEFLKQQTLVILRDKPKTGIKVWNTQRNWNSALSRNRRMIAIESQRNTMWQLCIKNRDRQRNDCYSRQQVGASVNAPQWLDYQKHLILIMAIFAKFSISLLQRRNEITASWS